MEIEVFADADAVAKRAAAFIAAEACAAVETRGRFVFAVSGGKTPWVMLEKLAREDVPWKSVHLVQVDERVAPPGHADRNMTHIQESLLAHAPLPAEQVHAMPVEASNLEEACAQYARLLARITGTPSVLDLVHLGLGPDGHTASLVPGDPVLELTDKDVAPTGVYQGRRRMTLTYPILDRARRILWLANGPEKVTMLARLRAGDQAIPAGRVRQASALIFADQAAVQV
jgi:6-phosphogluconolactonase